MNEYEYQHGGNAYFENTDILDLSANISPIGLPVGVDEAIQAAIKDLLRYPDNNSIRLRNRIAEYEDVQMQSIFCGNGASDIIFRLPLAIRPKKVMLFAPSFSDYERAARAFGADIVYHSLREESGFSIDGNILDEIKRQKADLLFICNPNNPTGVLTKRSMLAQILEVCSMMNTSVVVDECFIDFTEKAQEYTAKPLLQRYKNLIILKAFTKVFAMPGIRLGYAICAEPSFVGKLHYHGADWPVSNLAQAAGIAALENAQDYLGEALDFIAKERGYIKKELEMLGFTTYGSEANYVFFKSPYDFKLWEMLNERLVRIRRCDNYNGLSNCYFRVGISTAENNRKFISTMKEVMECQNP